MRKKLLFLLRHPLWVFLIPLTRFPAFRFLRETADYQGQVGFGFWYRQKILNRGGNRHVYWPVHTTSTVYDPENILVGVDAYPGIMQGCYIQGKGGIVIGDFTQIGPNVVIVSANHDPYDTRKHIGEPVAIGAYCWIGAGAKIMPGVTLGDWTVVGAGAVVTRSFPAGYCVLGGVPARPISTLDPARCISFSVSKRYRGYIREDRFDAYRKRHSAV